MLLLVFLKLNIDLYVPEVEHSIIDSLYLSGLLVPVYISCVQCSDVFYLFQFALPEVGSF